MTQHHAVKHIEKVQNPANQKLTGDLGNNVSKKQVRKWISSPKSRKVIYGVTDRIDDPLILKLNDFFIDYGRVKLKEKSLFFNSLKLLVNSGVGFTKSLAMLGERSRNVRLSRICYTMVYDMEHNGKSFSDAMSKYPNVFEKSEIKMVYSGELTGKIESTLDAVATQLQKSINLEMQIKSALLYPVTVFSAIILAGIIVMMFIVPRFMSLFTEFGSQLPWSTKILIGISSLFQNYWWLMLTILITIILVFNSWKKSPEGQRSLDGYFLKIPILKDLINNIQTVRIASNFSTLMSSGVPLNKAMRVLGEIMKNSVIGDAIFSAEIRVRKGMELHTAFSKEKAIDPVVSEILEVGEKTGHIDEVMEKLGTQYELEVDAQLKNLTTIIEPLIILIVGFAVVFMAMAIMLPIFQLQELFSGTM